MNKKKIIIIALVISFLGTSLLIAKGMYSHYKGKYYFYRGDFVSYLKEKIDLTDEQVDKLNAFIESTKDKRKEFRDKFKEKRQEVVDLFFKEGTSKEEINSKIDELNPDMLEFAKYMSGVVLDAKAILTKEQVEKLRESYNKRSCPLSKRQRKLN